ncbi:MAG: T9SS type A sorting domain-containing protein [Bacteroidia bacterium]|nr:T9SS type A sorting domain-containing protein [Bacteroidia bacterium]
MKKLFTTILVGAVCLTLNTQAQISHGGQPLSNHFPSLFKSVEGVELTAPDPSSLLAEDQDRAVKGSLYRIGTSLLTDIKPTNSGTWTLLPDGGKVWRLQVSASGAKALGFYFDQFHLPVGAQLFVYNENKSQVIGAFTSENNHESGYFATEMIFGSSAILELYIPLKSKGSNLQFHLNEVAYFYRNVYAPKDAKDFGDSESCEVNVNCSEGNNWANQKRGVARIMVKAGNQYGWCSGSLINNTNVDCSPLFLTADHCSEGTSASDLNQWVFYFNYQASGCTNPASQGTLANQTMTGATLKAQTTGMGNQDSDFYLVLLNNNVPQSYAPYFNGWDRNNTASTGGVGIHHPAGDIKKISTYTGTLVSSTYGGTVANTHWRVTWAGTANGHGVTEGGSSGSPLFGSNGLIVGQLTGGSSYCTAQTSPDLYGKFSYSWTSNGAAANRQLAPWLDPSSSGVTTLAGVNQPCVQVDPPVADFTANNTVVGIGQQVNFTDLSTNSPTSWSWSVSPNTYTYVQGTFPSSQNPKMTFSSAGYYTITLTATNDGGSDTEVKTNYILVTSGGQTTVCDTAFYFDGRYYGGSNLGANFSLDATNYDTNTPFDATNYSTEWMSFYELPSGTDTNWYLGSLSYFDAVATSNDWLTFGPVSIPAVGATLHWQHLLPDNDFRDGYSVKISTVGATVANLNAGATLYSATDNDPSTDGDTVWTDQSAVISAATYGGQNVYIGFKHVSTDMFFLLLDNLYIDYCTTIPVGISENDQLVSVYPNPSTGLITISGLLADSQLSLSDLSGRKLLVPISSNAGQAQMDLSNLANGMYLVNISNQGQTKAYKVQVIK